MSLVQYEPWGLVDQLHSEIGRLFDTGLNGAGGTKARRAAGDWLPAADIKEESDRYIIHVDVPGVNPDDIEIDMADGVLSVAGQRYRESAEELEGFRRMERSRGRFARRFSLPDTVDAGAISARSRDGVLEIVIPKLEKLQPKKIRVES